MKNIKARLVRAIRFMGWKVYYRAYNYVVNDDGCVECMEHPIRVLVVIKGNSSIVCKDETLFDCLLQIHKLCVDRYILDGSHKKEKDRE